VPTRQQALSAYRESEDYRAVGRALGIPAGQAYLVATGLPADGGDAFPPGEANRPGVLPGSTQHLVYEPVTVGNPTGKPETAEWVKQRAAADTPMQAAVRGHDAAPDEPAEALDRTRDQAGERLATWRGRAEREPQPAGRGGGRTRSAGKTPGESKEKPNELS
jgi:hypothetical protein